MNKKMSNQKKLQQGIVPENKKSVTMSIVTKEADFRSLR